LGAYQPKGLKRIAKKYDKVIPENMSYALNLMSTFILF